MRDLSPQTPVVIFGTFQEDRDEQTNIGNHERAIGILNDSAIGYKRIQIGHVVNGQAITQRAAILVQDSARQVALDIAADHNQSRLLDLDWDRIARTISIDGTVDETNILGRFVGVAPSALVEGQEFYFDESNGHYFTIAK